MIENLMKAWYMGIYLEDNIPELSRTCTFLIFKIGRMQPFIKATTTTQNGDGNYEWKFISIYFGVPFE